MHKRKAQMRVQEVQKGSHNQKEKHYYQKEKHEEKHEKSKSIQRAYQGRITKLQNAVGTNI